MNKYTYLYVLQGHYGRWEDLCASESYREIKNDHRAYMENEGGLYRIINRRHPNRIEPKTKS